MSKAVGFGTELKAISATLSTKDIVCTAAVKSPAAILSVAKSMAD